MNNVEIVKRFGEAFFDKDINTVKGIVSENYSFKGPMMEMNSREELIGFIENMPMQASEVKTDYVEQGNKVVKICTFDFTAPPIGPQDMCEIFTVEDGKITGAQLYYDASKFPNPEEAGEAA